MAANVTGLCATLLARESDVGAVGFGSTWGLVVRHSTAFGTSCAKTKLSANASEISAIDSSEAPNVNVLDMPTLDILSNILDDVDLEEANSDRSENDQDDQDDQDDAADDADIEVEDPLGLIVDGEDAPNNTSTTIGMQINIDAADWRRCVKAVMVECPQMFTSRLEQPTNSKYYERAVDAINRVDNLKKRLIDDAPLYASGFDTTQIESIHHTRRRYKNKFYKHISGRVHQAGLRWNVGWTYAIDVLQKQGYELSDNGISSFKAMTAAQEKERTRNLTVAQRIYKYKRKAFVKARGQPGQSLDIYAYGDKPTKRQRADIPAARFS